MTKNVVKFEQRQVVRVDPISENVDEALEKSLFLLMPSIEAYSRNVDVEDIVDDLIAGRSLLWHVYLEDTLVAAFTTSVVQHPRRKTLFIEFMGGVDMKVWMKAALLVLKDVCIAMGLSGIEADGRIGFSRFAKENGFVEAYRHFEMEI